jgi:hypothetical protein
MDVPQDPNLPIHLLAACFNNTSATYKFYWFLAILHQVEQGKTEIPKQDLFADMVAQAWFTVNYFHISFGKQDKLQQAIEIIKMQEDLTIDTGRDVIRQRLAKSVKSTTQKALNYFNSEVPHRFLSPWFRAADTQTAYLLSQSFNANCPYALYKDHIVINSAWEGYLRRHAGILKGFCYWHLTLYLQSKNPNVPDIANKLIKLPIRKALTAQRKQFWDIVIGELGKVDCIYTNRSLHIGDYAVEHFIPYAFVSHDLIWNLIPADRSFNSIKCDKLPLLEQHFDAFFDLQKNAVAVMQYKAPKNKFLQDYLTLFPGLTPEYFNRQKFREQVEPLITIASHNGFEFLSV